MLLAACGGDTSVSAPTASSSSPPSVEAAIALICEPPAYDECVADMTKFFDGWTTDNLRGQMFGVCDFSSGNGDVVWIDAASEAEAECEAAQGSVVIQRLRWRVCA